MAHIDFVELADADDETRTCLLARKLYVPRKVAAKGLSAPVEIVDDPYGVPHIRAQSIPDAFFGQGYVVARDRLFQIDLSHRREMGLLAEAYGPAFADNDARERLFHFRGDIDARRPSAHAFLSNQARAHVSCE